MVASDLVFQKNIMVDLKCFLVKSLTQLKILYALDVIENGKNILGPSGASILSLSLTFRRHFLSPSSENELMQLVVGQAFNHSGFYFVLFY